MLIQFPICNPWKRSEKRKHRKTYSAANLWLVIKDKFETNSKTSAQDKAVQFKWSKKSGEKLHPKYWIIQICLRTQSYKITNVVRWRVRTCLVSFAWHGKNYNLTMSIKYKVYNSPCCREKNHQWRHEAIKYSKEIISDK
jgi:hypothetical protein